MEIIPAILEKDFLEIEKKLSFLRDVKNKYGLNFKVVQIDLCDGRFVESLTWLPDEIPQNKIEDISSFKTFFDIEYHLMCKDMLSYFVKLKALNPKRVVIHIDHILFGEEINKIIQEAESSLIKLTISARISFLEDHKEDIALFLSQNINIDLQIMGIENIGIQGQVFDERCLSIIKFFRDKFSRDELFIQIDGGVDNNTIKKIVGSGADGAVVGSFLLKSMEETGFISNFKSLQY
ncbi:MAG: hypothetical protein RI945_98 [Candidatus Parcubacteria bacterium]|jgi:ribulose-phosphate 3-epimerase